MERQQVVKTDSVRPKITEKTIGDQRFSSTEKIMEELSRFDILSSENKRLNTLLQKIYPGTSLQQEEKVGAYYSKSQNELLFSVPGFGSLTFRADLCSPLLLACVDTVLKKNLNPADYYKIDEYPENITTTLFNIIKTIDKRSRFNPPSQRSIEVILDWLHKKKIYKVFIKDNSRNFIFSFVSLEGDPSIKHERIFPKKDNINTFSAKLLLAGDIPKKRLERHKER